MKSMRIPFALLMFSLVPHAFAELTAYQSCGIELGLPELMPGVAGMESRFVRPDRLDLEQKKRLVACADKRANAELTADLTRALADDIGAGRVPAPVAIPDPSSSTRGKPEIVVPGENDPAFIPFAYKSCGILYNFPKAPGGEPVPVRELSLAHKKKLTDCAGNPVFVEWVNRELADDIRSGSLRPARAQPRGGGALPGPRESFGSLVPFFGVLAFIVAVGAAIGAFARRRGASLGTTAKVLAFGGLALLLYGRFGFYGAKLDEMDAMRPLLIVVVGLIALAIGALWALVRIFFTRANR